jgi:hypothetical protein
MAIEKIASILNINLDLEIPYVPRSSVEIRIEGYTKILCTLMKTARLSHDKNVTHRYIRAEPS